MNTLSTQIDAAIESAVKASTLIAVQQSADYASVISGYQDLKTAFLALSEEDKDIVIKEVRKTRPLIGKRLFESFTK